MKAQPSKVNIPRLSQQFSFIALLTFCLLLAGLSCTRFTYSFLYNRADYFLLREISSLFGIDSTQEALLKKDFAETLAWHKKNELSRYLTLIRSARNLAMGKNLEKAKIFKLVSELLNCRDKIYYKLELGLLGLFFTLSKDQISQFEKKIQEQNRETYEDNFSMSLENQIKQRMEKTTERWESWFGKFNSMQKKIMNAFITKNPHARRIWFEEKKKNQERFIIALKNNRSERKLRETLRTLLRIKDPSQRSPELKNWFKDSITFVYELVQSLTNQQKQTFQKELTDISDTIIHIIQS